MDALRTPDERLADLPGYSFEPHYVDIAAMRMHYVDEGFLQEDKGEELGQVVVEWLA